MAPVEEEYFLQPGAYVRHIIYARQQEDGGFTCYVDLEVGGAVQRTRCVIIPMDRAATSFDIRVLDDAQVYWFGYANEHEYIDAVTRKVMKLR